MTLKVTLARSVPAIADMVVVPVFSDDVGDRPAGLDWGVLEAAGFDAGVGTTSTVGGDGAVNLVVGLGRRAEIDANTWRSVGIAIGKNARRNRVVGAALLDLVPDDDRRAVARSLAEGIVLGCYSFTSWKSDPKTSTLRRVAIVGRGRGLSAAVRVGAHVGGCINWARDLVNRPGGDLTPPEFAAEAATMAGREGLSSKVLTRAGIERAKLGGLLGVNRGSYHDPRLVRLTYTPTGRPSGHVVLVGKGITFDSGGLSIKTMAGMMTMKDDMGGGAAVLGAMASLSAVAPRVKVTAIVPMTDNMVGPNATRPGDVLTIRNGKTVEVLNTDAEGRLVLADGLSLAGEASPDAIIDVATLTGACMVALGKKYAGLMGNDEGWVDQVAMAADRSGELVWKLPLPAEYREKLDSEVADLKNIGGSHAGALTAGLFLQEFVPDGVPWAHIDIAGPAWSDADEGDTPKGATGFGVRTLVSLLEHFDAPS
ncbi:MAG: leucyl aminopeptidase [Acidimicrobiia bacterium]|nr:leucyl aminopeptidase [Acidimicrobiia bacterium]